MSTVARAAETKSEARPLSLATVLVVDDDASWRRSLDRLLSTSGFCVKTFGNAAEVLASEIPTSNACLVADIHMPEMTGIEMCEKLKGSGRGVPTILISGRSDARTRALAAQSNPVAVLFKPCEEGSLLEAIGHALALST